MYIFVCSYIYICLLNISHIYIHAKYVHIYAMYICYVYVQNADVMNIYIYICGAYVRANCFVVHTYTTCSVARAEWAWADRNTNYNNSAQANSNARDVCNPYRPGLNRESIARAQEGINSKAYSIYPI